MTESADDRSPSKTIEEALHVELDMDFQDAVDAVQLEHEIAGFETIQVTRMDQLILGVLEEEVERACLIIMCHAEVARDALAIDRSLAGLLPCTTAVYERPEDDLVHVRHFSVTKAMRDLGAVPEKSVELDELVEKTGEHMSRVWEHVERLGAEDS